MNSTEISSISIEEIQNGDWALETTFNGISLYKLSNGSYQIDLSLYCSPSITALTHIVPDAYILTLVSQHISYQDLKCILKKVCHQGELIAIKTLSLNPVAIEIVFIPSIELNNTQWQEWLLFSEEYSIDIGLKSIQSQGTRCRLACFDMDSTLIKAEVIDELAAEAGLKEKVSEITESAMRGELNFQESFRKRLGLLKGLPEHAVQTVMQRIELMDGAEELFKYLAQQGIYSVILSGGFDVFAQEVSRKLGIHEIHSNKLKFESGLLTGEAQDPIMDAERKQATLIKIAERLHIPLSQTLAVGDGANDLLMLGCAGIGVAFRAKPKVQASARIAIRFGTLADVPFFLGFTK